MDIEYIADSSLAVAQYVTEYVTKAEASHMKEDFAEIVATRVSTVNCGVLG